MSGGQDLAMDISQISGDFNSFNRAPMLALAALHCNLRQFALDLQDWVSV